MFLGDLYNKKITESIDTVTLDIPLMIRMLEYAREDAKNDMDLHDVTERLIALSQEGGTLSMDDYNAIVGKLSEAFKMPAGRINGRLRRQQNESLRDGEYYLYRIEFADGKVEQVRVRSDWFDPKMYYAQRGRKVVKAERIGGIHSDDFVAPRNASGGDAQERQDQNMQAMRRYDKQMTENRDDMVGFVLETERAYQAVIDRFGHVIDHDEESGIMYAPWKFWGRIQEVAYDADGIGAEESNGYENPEHYGLDEQGVAEGSEQKFKVSYDIYGSNREKPLYTNTRTVTARSEKEAIDTVRKLVGGTNYRVEKVVGEAGPFSYGAKKPRKGSLKHQMAQQSKKYWDQQPVVEPKDQMIGTARVVKDVKEESVLPPEAIEIITKIAQSSASPEYKKAAIDAVVAKYLKPALSENAEDLNVGDPVIITGNVQFNGATGEIDSFGRDKRFVIVNLYNHGKHSFHSSDVSYNDYADSDDEDARAYDNDPGYRNWASSREINEDIEQYIEELERAGYGIKEEKQRLDPKCWKGYRKAGTKMKGGVRVNNCVPVKKK